MPEQEVNFFEEDEDQDFESDFRINPSSELAEIQRIVVSGSDWTTATILDQMIRENIELNPRFQRRDAWDITRKSRFIESLMLGFPIPQIVLAFQEKRGNFIVLDGKQRLLTILQFYGRSETPNNAFALKNLEFRTDMNSSTYEELRSNFLLKKELNNLDNQTIRTIVVRNVESDNFLYKIFLRLNVQSTPLSAQELRQALHPGSFINFLDDQSIKSKALKKIFKSPNPDFRMRDVELLLRYVGFHYFLSGYRGNLKAFLDETCLKLNKDWDKRHNDIENVVNKFEKAVQTTINIFQEKNFCRMWLKNDNTYRRRFNKAILDVMVFYFSDEIIRQSAERNKEKVEEVFKKLCSSNSKFREGVEGTTKNITETYNRLVLWGESLLEVLDVEFNLPEFIDNRIVFNDLR
ncbi:MULTISPECIES: DUF262 domain-containing protein [unclassified Nodularia (in: cyanobacteria)]|uniref:DUF262 domain-containing protein n=1 Tax=unclassified Nodularia (in: cyanobacteria) TaxID=2656917 RepID=UPI0018825B2D|nr:MULTISPECIES: DUF262 domain-containing protein [unclassified Nodularia (in: cyanobacteria)]MBE9199186.1 DUF262 domain-containing protein [Nodularia sp. LEGE 06071]MCC2696023.1 DUF262 domain-containing protein [Nodularia sp. LEGE 04288]